MGCRLQRSVGPARRARTPPPSPRRPLRTPPRPARYRDQGGRDRSDLSSPATWELYVEMRFTQLRTACDLELWAEAFRRCARAAGCGEVATRAVVARAAGGP